MTEINQSKAINFCSEIARACYPTFQDQQEVERSFVLGNGFISDSGHSTSPPLPMRIAAYHYPEAKPLPVQSESSLVGLGLLGATGGTG